MEDLGRLDEMKSKINSFETIKERFRKGVIEPLNYIEENEDKILEKSGYSDPDYYYEDILRDCFSRAHTKECTDASLPSNSRWGIVALKNVFGLEAELFPRYEKEKDIILKACSGRFQTEKFPFDFFPKTIDITNIGKRKEKEQFTEFEEFYNMNNRQVFEKFGVNANRKELHILVANCLILDSLLEEKYSQLEKVLCWQPGAHGNTIEIKIEDGTEIFARERDGFTLKIDGKEAGVKFDTKTIGERFDNILTDVNNLDVENVEYTGNPELIMQLKKAIQEQFKSQKQKEESDKELKGQPAEAENILTEKTGAEKIIEFMNQNNLGAHDLSLAFTIALAKTTDKTMAGQQIVSTFGKDEHEVENIKPEQ